MDNIDTPFDTVIIGAGLAGLTAAAHLARARRRVLVLERAAEIGGRARTEHQEGFSINLGAHALYRGGAAPAILRELGVDYSGHMPAVSGGYALFGGTKHTLPSGTFSLMTTDLLPLGGKFEIAALLGRLKHHATKTGPEVDLATWTQNTMRDLSARALVEALMRLGTYGSHPPVTSAQASLRQLVLALEHNVDYIDGGWGTIVHGLATAASAAGARIVTGARVANVKPNRVVLEDGTAISTGSVILGVAPRTASELLEGPARERLARFADRATPALVACLDVALDRLLNPRATFGLGIDRPLYVSVHSKTAKLAPDGCALIHCMKYLDPHAAQDPRADERELEDALELLQPGWRGAIVKKRFLPRMTAMNAVLPPKRPGEVERPAVAVSELAGVFLAGDWVGDGWMLTDAALASAKEAATRAFEFSASGVGARAA